jgi:hypothetical protein
MSDNITPIRNMGNPRRHDRRDEEEKEPKKSTSSQGEVRITPDDLPGPRVKANLSNEERRRIAKLKKKFGLKSFSSVLTMCLARVAEEEGL